MQCQHTLSVNGQVRKSGDDVKFQYQGTVKTFSNLITNYCSTPTWNNNSFSAGNAVMYNAAIYLSLNYCGNTAVPGVSGNWIKADDCVCP